MVTRILAKKETSKKKRNKVKPPLERTSDGVDQ